MSFAKVVVELFPMLFLASLGQSYATLHCLYCIKEPGVDSAFLHWKHDFLRHHKCKLHVRQYRVYLFLKYTGICYIVYLILKTFDKNI